VSAFSKALVELLVLEGGLVDNPADPGGRTNLGITQLTLDAVRSKYPGLPAKVDELTPDTVAPVYKGEYWDAVRGDELPQALASCVFKQAVNQGVPRAVIELQQSLELIVDGNLGPVTVAAAQRKHPPDAVADFIVASILNYTRSSNFATFGKGWIRRAALTAVEAFA
jgi:lysozyme family protein